MKAMYSTGPFVWVGILATTCLVLFIFQKILWLVIPFMLATIFYYLLLPLVKRLIILGLSFQQSIILVIGVLFLCSSTLTIYTLFYALPESAKLQKNTSDYVEGAKTLISTTLGDLEKRVPFLKEAGINEEVTSWISSKSSHFAHDYLADFLIELAQWLPSLLLVPYLTYFLLSDAAKFKQFIVRAVPNAFFEKTLLLVFRVGEQVRRYFQGLMLLTFLDAVCLSGGLWGLGLSSPIFLGLLTSILAWIPYVGSMFGCLIVVLFAATDHPNNPVISYGAIGVFIVVRLLDDFVFMPLTIGRSLRVHPLITVLMIFVGGAVAGISGLLLVMPVLGVVMVIGEVVGEVLTDERLRARHALARALEQSRAEEHLR